MSKQWSIIITGLFGLASTVSFHVPNFVQSVGFSATMAATGINCVTIGQTGGKFLLGAINDKLGVKTALFIGIGGGMLGVVALLISDSFGIGMLYTRVYLTSSSRNSRSIRRARLRIHLYNNHVSLYIRCGIWYNIIQLHFWFNRFLLYCIHYCYCPLYYYDFFKFNFFKIEIITNEKPRRSHEIF